MKIAEHHQRAPHPSLPLKEEPHALKKPHALRKLLEKVADSARNAPSMILWLGGFFLMIPADPFTFSRRLVRPPLRGGFSLSVCLSGGTKPPAA